PGLASGCVLASGTEAAGDRPELTVPAPAADDDPRTQADAMEATDRLSILVADDNTITRSLIAKILEKAGHEPTTVENGQAAADMASTSSVEALLLAPAAPLPDGIEAANLIRFLSTGRSRVPIVGMATLADEITPPRCEEAGMAACLAKPIDPAGLLRAL